MTRIRTRAPLTVVDLFAGPGGWDVAAAERGLRPVGIEKDYWASATGRAAGHRRVTLDVRSMRGFFERVDGLIGSPPCPTFSSAGNGSGTAILSEIVEAVDEVTAESVPVLSDADERTALVLEPLLWALRYRPRWIVLEQVPQVLPIWRAFAARLKGMGYSAVAGNLTAEQFGVPQTRKRALLIASLDRDARLPRPTHSRYHARCPNRLDEGVRPWVSISEALGWSADGFVRSNYGSGGDPSDRGERSFDEPAATVTGRVGRNLIYRSTTMPNSARRSIDSPAPTIAFGHDAASAAWVLRSNQSVDGVGRAERSVDLPALLA